MKIKLEVNNQTAWQISEAQLKEIFKETLQLVGMACLQAKTVELSVALVDAAEIAKLNKQYRAKDKVTDVLSFAEYENREQLCAVALPEVLLGELIICPEFIAQSAQEQGFTWDNEFIYIVSHGILHLVGFDHEEEMFAIQAQVVEKIIAKK